MTTATDIHIWIDKLKAARNRSELFSMLDQFRILDWTDEERSKIARLYMRLLGVLPDDKTPTADEPKQSDPLASAAGDDEEVWYEKM